MKPLTKEDLVNIALNSKNIDVPIDRALATYADPNNWGKIYDEERCYWVWKGPTICAYDLAGFALKHNNNKNKERENDGYNDE